MNRYYNPVRTLEGPGSLSSLPEILNGMEPDSKRILLLVWSEEVLKKSGIFLPSGPEIRLSDPPLLLSGFQSYGGAAV